MGRKRTNNPLKLPPRLRHAYGAFYYDWQGKPRKWEWLSKDRTEALSMWAEREGKAIPAVEGTFRAVWQTYEKEVLPAKAPRTQADNKKEAAHLMPVFGDMQVADVRPLHIRKYMVLRGKVAKIRATREKALFSHIFNYARATGITDKHNPCRGIPGWTAGRTIYVEDGWYKAVWDQADQPTRDAMDLALLAGQRPADVLKLRRQDLRDGVIEHQQNKRGRKQRIVIEGELKQVIDRCIARAAAHQVACLHLVQTERGQPLSYRNLNSRFVAARLKAIAAGTLAAGDTFQFKDIRAKTASDLEDLGHAQSLLGHEGRAMTEHYVRGRRGDRVRPLR